MMPDMPEAPTSVPPLASEVEEEEKRLTLKSVLAGSACILAASAATIFSVRRAVYDRLRPQLQEVVHVPLSNETGFALTAASVTGPVTFAMMVRKKKSLTRRELLKAAFVSSGAAMVAGVGGAGGSAAVDTVGQSMASGHRHKE